VKPSNISFHAAAGPIWPDYHMADLETLLLPLQPDVEAASFGWFSRGMHRKQNGASGLGHSPFAYALAN